MARYTGPKNRLARREGIDLGLKTVGSKAHIGLLRRIGIIPGLHGVKGRRKISDYGSQLREKQKVKRMYGLLERQFRKVFERSKKWKGNTGEKLLEFLERRLDNAVYRMGLSPTRGFSRQIVTHGHVLVNGKKVSIPSYLVSVNDVIMLKSKALAMSPVQKLLEDKAFKTPEWIERAGPVGKITRHPVRTDVNEDINEKLIIEHYSR